MNAKKAKLLRKLARDTAREPETGETLPESRYHENTRRRKYKNVTRTSGDGKSTYTDKELVATGTITCDKRTVRGLYREMKKMISRIK
jgi:hypothetical protein